MSSENIGLLFLRTWSQQTFKISINVYLDPLLNCQTFLPKLGMVVQRHKLGCHANSWVAVLKVRSQGSDSKYDCFNLLDR